MKVTRWLHAVFKFTTWALVIGLQATQAGTLNTNQPSAQSTIPYVATRHDTVRDLLWMADVGTNDVVYDLGSGDGRVVIAAVRDFHARKAVGIEIKPELFRESRASAEKAGVADRVQFIEGDLFTNDVSEASVVALYLGHGANLNLRSELVRSLKPGARIVSHEFRMGEWPADKTFEVRTAVLGMQSRILSDRARAAFSNNPDVPDFGSTGLPFGYDYLSVWIVPAPVAGVWRGKVSLGPGEADMQIVLHQRLSRITGSFQLKGPTSLEGSVYADLWGDHLRYQCSPTNRSPHSFEIWFDGRVSNDTMSGDFWFSRTNGTQTLKWVGRRDKADFAGTWEWTGAMDSPVQLKIERQGERWAVAYQLPLATAFLEARGNQAIATVTDFYDFGGGFYFTVLLGDRSSSGRRMMGPEMGWLIGEAVAQESGLAGNIAFFPYRDPEIGRLGAADAASGTNTLASPADRRPVIREGWHNWQPKRVAP